MKRCHDPPRKKESDIAANMLQTFLKVKVKGIKRHIITADAQNISLLLKLRSVEKTI
jgi:hypothetical protein